MADTIKFLKTREVKSPSRAHDFDAGIDFYVPKFEASFITALKKANEDLFPTKNPYENYGVNVCNGTISSFSTASTLTIVGNTNNTKVEYDLVDSNDTSFRFDEEKGLNYFPLAPHSRINIPSGIKVRMQTPGRALIAFNKSGVATKLGLVTGAAVVDYLYQGEVHLSVINTSTKIVRIYEDMKLLQFIETPVFNSEISVCGDETTPEVFYKGMQTDRGTKGFGSTDKK